MAVAVGFDGDVISCELARRGVRHGAAEASARERGNAVGLTSILDRRQFFIVGYMRPSRYRSTESRVTAMAIFFRIGESAHLRTGPVAHSLPVKR